MKKTLTVLYFHIQTGGRNDKLSIIDLRLSNVVTIPENLGKSVHVK